MSDMDDVPLRNDVRDGEGVDPRLREILAVLDPARTDPAYWERFHRSVLRSASAELARRRALLDLSVSDLMSSWARAVVPTALLAAAAAGLVLFEGSPLDRATASASGDEAVIGVEEALIEGLEGDRIPAMLADDALTAGVTFAAEIF